MLDDYMSFAKMRGYEIRYTGIGMAYLELNGHSITEIKDVNVIRKEMTLIGLAILADTLRGWDPNDFAEPTQEEDEEDDVLDDADYIEWCAASGDMTYNEYIGKPWLD